MFPEIKTRRLGVRGQSKYHYCGIRLAGEQSSPKVSQGSGSASGSEPPAQAAGDDHLQVFNPSAPLSAELLTVNRKSNGSAQPFSNASFQTSIENTIENSSFYKTSSLSTEYPISSFLHQELHFSCNESDHLSTPNEILKLPNIDLYAPVGTDPDIAATLTAIYRSHCTSLVECVRYMRLKQFHQLFISFHGTLTAPVQKLLGEPSLALWIRESDWVMYKVWTPLTLLTEHADIIYPGNVTVAFTVSITSRTSICCNSSSTSFDKSHLPHPNNFFCSAPTCCSSKINSIQHFLESTGSFVTSK